MIDRARINSSQEVLSGRRDLLEAAASGINDVLVIQGFDVPLVTDGEKAAQVISAYAAETLNHRRGQVNVTDFALDMVNNTDLGNPAVPDFILLDTDLFNERTNFVFGCTWASLGLSVQSIARVMRYTNDPGLQRLHTRHVARHEFAHLRGLNKASDYLKPDSREGIYQGHCADTCTMRQCVTVEEAITQAKELENHELAGFCTGCFRTLWNKRYN